MKPFIVQVDCKCDDCAEELPRGSQCFLDDESIICEECYNQRENDNNLEQRYENNNEEDDSLDSELE
jgi:hypothetical protein